MTINTTLHPMDSPCTLTSEEFELIATGLSAALHRLSAPEPLRQELSMHFESLRSRVVLVKPAADARRY
jgi:hypothetical protein